MNLTEDQALLRASTRRFALDQVSPVAAELDRQNRWSEPLWDKLRELGVTGAAFSGSDGGGGGTYLDFALMIEELARSSAAAALMPSLNVLVARALQQFGTETARAQYLHSLVTGSSKACWVFTEAATGSDPKAIETKAVTDGDGWRINGSKAFISHSSVATVAVIFARTGERLSAFLVDCTQPGVQPGARYDLLGLRGADTGDLVLEDVWVPPDNLLGDIGDGMKVLVSIESEAKIRSSAMCVGMAQAALDEAITYGLAREHRGTAIAEKFPTIQALIADIAAAAESSRWLTYHVASLVDADTGANIPRLAAMAKLHCSQSAMRAASASMQVHGAYGYTSEFAISRIFRDAKAYEMIQGSAEIQRTIIAKSLLGERT